MRIVPPEERNGDKREWCCVCEKMNEQTIRLHDRSPDRYWEDDNIDICYQCLGEATRLIVPSL